MTRSTVPTVLAVLAFLLPLPATGNDGFCVEDADDALWIDCEEAVVGAPQQTRVLCRREPGAALTLVEPVRRLAPGESRCPAAGTRLHRLVTDDIPRSGDENEPGTADE